MADENIIGRADWTPTDLALAVATTPPSEASTVLRTIVSKLEAISGITDASAVPHHMTESLSKVLQPWYCLEQPLLGLLAKFEAEVSMLSRKSSHGTLSSSSLTAHAAS